MNRRAARLIFLSIAASLFATSAGAHTGAGPMSGFMHPFAGLDHVLAMLAIGLWAGQLGGRARLAVPVAFVALMVCGAIVALAGVHVPATETGIVASVIVLGLLVASTATATPLIGAVVAGAFALFHGAAHGTGIGIGSAAAMTYILGFAASSAILHLAGLGIAETLRRLQAGIAVRIMGGATAVAGLALAAA